MPPDNIDLVGCQAEIPAGVFRGFSRMRGPVPVGRQPLCLNIIEIIVMQKGSPGKFPLVDLPPQLLRKPEARLGNLNTVA